MAEWQRKLALELKEDGTIEKGRGATDEHKRRDKHGKKQTLGR
ncbi:MAG: hypothetical protein NT166_07245 [Candidatus Aminicenantes bacterium]|nr:hypothetical protein [Candidatus Aminicenantes bacterium]